LFGLHILLQRHELHAVVQILEVNLTMVPKVARNGIATTGVAKPTIAPTNPLLLSLRDHREIIVVYKRGESLLTIAERFGVTCADVQRIMARVGDLGRVLADPTTGEGHVSGAEGSAMLGGARPYLPNAGQQGAESQPD
jgi:hypothetical protein